jgi:hypothetical protein
MRMRLFMLLIVRSGLLAPAMIRRRLAVANSITEIGCLAG